MDTNTQMTLQQFGASVKAKYPAYASKSDEEVANAVLQKYPVYQSRIITNTPQNNTQQLQSGYNPTFPTNNTETNPIMAGIKDTGRFIGNIPSSAFNIAKGVLQTAYNAVSPSENARNSGVNIGQNIVDTFNTAKDLYSLGAKNTAIGAGQGVEDLISSGYNKAKDTFTHPETTLQNIHDQIINDPVGTAFYLKQAIDAGKSITNPEIAGKVGLQDTAKPINNAIGKIDTGISDAGQLVTNPIKQYAIKPVVDMAIGKATAMSKSLEENSLRLTPVQKANLGNKLGEITQFNIEHNITGSPEIRLEKANSLYDATENRYQEFLNKDAKDRFVDKNHLIEQMNGIKNQYKNDRDYKAIVNQVDDAIDTIKNNQPDQIPVANLNEFKRSTYSGAYNKAGTKVLDTVEHDIGDIARKNIEQATQGLKIDGHSVNEFNKQYGTLIQSRKLLKIASGRPQLGLVGKLTSKFIGGLIGSAVGGPIGEGAGILVGDTVGNGVAGTSAKTNTAQTIKSATNKALQLSNSLQGKQTIIDSVKSILQKTR